MAPVKFERDIRDMYHVVPIQQFEHPKFIELKTNDGGIASTLVKNTQMHLFGSFYQMVKYDVRADHQAGQMIADIRLEELQMLTGDHGDFWWKKNEVLVQRVPNEDTVMMILDNTYYTCTPVKDTK